MGHRFSDFFWFRDMLSRENPGVLVPPLPPKHVPLEKVFAPCSAFEWS